MKKKDDVDRFSKLYLNRSHQIRLIVDKKIKGEQKNVFCSIYNFKNRKFNVILFNNKKENENSAVQFICRVICDKLEKKADKKDSDLFTLLSDTEDDLELKKLLDGDGKYSNITKRMLKIAEIMENEKVRENIIKEWNKFNKDGNANNSNCFEKLVQFSKHLKKEHNSSDKNNEENKYITFAENVLQITNIEEEDLCSFLLFLYSNLPISPDHYIDGAILYWIKDEEKRENIFSSNTCFFDVELLWNEKKKKYEYLPPAKINLNNGEGYYLIQEVPCKNQHLDNSTENKKFFKSFSASEGSSSEIDEVFKNDIFWFNNNINITDANDKGESIRIFPLFSETINGKHYGFFLGNLHIHIQDNIQDNIQMYVGDISQALFEGAKNELSDAPIKYDNVIVDILDKIYYIHDWESATVKKNNEVIAFYSRENGNWKKSDTINGINRNNNGNKILKININDFITVDFRESFNVEDYEEYRGYTVELEYPGYFVFPNDESEKLLIEKSLKMQFLSIFKTMLVKHKVLNSSVKVAIGAIMSRNMSHNIGSHVLSAVTNSFAGNVDDVRRLIGYLQMRMDYISLTITEFPKWTFSAYLISDIMRRFYRQRLLLNYIVRSEDLVAQEYYKEENGNNSYKCYKMANDSNNHKNKNGENISKKKNILDIVIKKGKKEIVAGNTENISPEEDVQVAIPGGIVGYHAFYTILENFIRNSAKHGFSAKKNEVDKIDELIITLDIEEKDDEVTVKLYDNVNTISAKDINDKIETSFIDLQSGELKKENWGIAEMKISAGYLQRRSLIDIASEGKKASHIIKAVDDGKKTVLCYEFDIPKPKDVLIITGESLEEETNNNLKKSGIYIEKELPPNYRDYDFVVFLGKEENIKEENFGRVIKLEKNESNSTKTAIDLGKKIKELKGEIKDLKKIKELAEEIKRAVYIEYLNSLLNGEKSGKESNKKSKKIKLTVNTSGNGASNNLGYDFKDILTEILADKEIIKWLCNFDSEKSLCEFFGCKKHNEKMREDNNKGEEEEEKEEFDVGEFKQELSEYLKNNERDTLESIIVDSIINQVVDEQHVDNCNINIKIVEIIEKILKKVYLKYEETIETLPCEYVAKNGSKKNENENERTGKTNDKKLSGDWSDILVSFNFNDSIILDNSDHNDVYDVEYSRHKEDFNGDYGESLSGSQTYFTLFENLPDLDNMLKDRLIFNMIESALFDLTIIDERTADFVGKKGVDKKFKKMKIHAYREYNEFINNGENNKGENNKDEGKNLRIIIMHAGPKSGEELTSALNKLKERARYVFVTSGRGKPADLPKDAKFIAFSNIESTILKQYPEKLVLINMLMKIREN